MPNPGTHDPSVLLAFKEYDKARRIRLTKIGCLIVIVLTLAGAPLDSMRYSAQAVSFLEERLLVALLAAVVWTLLSLRVTRAHYHVWGIVLPLLPAFGNAWNLYLTDGAASPYWAAFILVIVPTALLLPWTFQENLLVSLVTIAFYVWSCSAHGMAGWSGDFWMHLFFLATIAAICVVGTYYTSQTRFNEFVARLELDENRKRLEESNQKLINLDQVKTRFFANISHEIRTPLTLLLAPLENLRILPLFASDDDARTSVDTMYVNAMRLLKLINDLLDLVKLESGRLPVHREPLDVEPFVAGLLQSVERMALDKKIRLAAKVEPGLGHLPLDRDKLEKILLNLIFNSIKFTPLGGTVEVSAARRDDHLRLAVKDTGIGIAEKDLPHIFDRFYQVDDSSRRKTGGTGIGLALVKELAEVLGGAVEAVSHPSTGTVITVILPVGESVEAEIGTGEPPAPETPSMTSNVQWLTDLHHRAELFPAITPPKDQLVASEVPGTQHKPLILIADDEPEMRRFLKAQLSRHYEVLEAVDGNQALAKARQYEPEMILLDMMMPEKDGLEVCREVRGDPRLQGIPIVLLTAWADEATKLRSLAAGADDFLTKPFSMTEIRTRIQNLLKNREMSRSLAQQNRALQEALVKIKATEAELVQSEKLNALGQMSAGLIHEINNPLNYTLSAIHMLKTLKDRLPEGEKDSYQERLGDVEDGVRRVLQLITDLKSFSHRNSQSLSRVDLAASVQMAVRFQSHQVSKLNCDLSVELPPDFEAQANHNQLVQVLVNLISNALEAMRSKAFGPGVQPRLEIRGGAQGDRVWLSVADNGVGIPEEIRARVFDPFFTTKDVGEGMGLGLSICYRLVEEMGGKLSFESEAGVSTRFKVELPANPAVPAVAIGVPVGSMGVPSEHR